jgi:hypothetical protein
VGFIATDLLFRVVFEYDIIGRYRHAMAFHFASKYWKSDAAYMLYFPFLSALEYALWLGVPIVMAAFTALGSAVGQFKKRRADMNSILSTSLFGVLVLLAMFSRTGPEAARIWMFLIPFVCLVVGNMLATGSAVKERILVPVILGLQGVTILLVKLNQDFG